jgi:hypothetical protein
MFLLRRSGRHFVFQYGYLLWLATRDDCLTRGPLFPFAEQRLDLFGVVQVVASGQAREVFNRLLTALGMHTILLPLLGRERSEEIEISLSKYAQLLDRLARVPLLVMTCGRPRILIVSLNRSSRSAQDLPDAPGGDYLRFSEMRENLGGRPFAGRGPLVQPGRGEVLN